MTGPLAAGSPCPLDKRLDDQQNPRSGQRQAEQQHETFLLQDHAPAQPCRWYGQQQDRPDFGPVDQAARLEADGSAGHNNDIAQQSDDRQRPVIERGQCQQGNIGGATAKTDAGIERGGYRKQQRQAEN